VSGSGVSWAISKSAPGSRQITMPAPHRWIRSRISAQLLYARVAVPQTSRNFLPARIARPPSLGARTNRSVAYRRSCVKRRARAQSRRRPASKRAAAAAAATGNNNRCRWKGGNWDARPGAGQAGTWKLIRVSIIMLRDWRPIERDGQMNGVERSRAERLYTCARTHARSLP